LPLPKPFRGAILARNRRGSGECRLKEALRLRDQIFLNPQSSAAIKKQAQSSVEKIQKLVMELILLGATDNTTMLDELPADLGRALGTDARQPEEAALSITPAQNS
jgi:hypothetical protein